MHQNHRLGALQRAEMALRAAADQINDPLLVGLASGLRAIREAETEHAPDLYVVAQRAYEAYGRAVGWRTTGGQVMPRWDRRIEQLSRAWLEATRGALGLPLQEAEGALAPI